MDRRGFLAAVASAPALAAPAWAATPESWVCSVMAVHEMADSSSATTCGEWLLKQLDEMVAKYPDEGYKLVASGPTEWTVKRNECRASTLVFAVRDVTLSRQAC